MTVSPCNFPVTPGAPLALPGWESSRTMRLATPKPPCSLNPRAKDSDANSPSAPPEPELESSSSPVSVLPEVNGFNNSFIICASNSLAARTSLGCDATELPNPLPPPLQLSYASQVSPSKHFHHRTSRSASSAPASFMACRIEITSRAPAPVRCNSCTRSSTVAPSFRSMRFTGLSWA